MSATCSTPRGTKTEKIAHMEHVERSPRGSPRRRSFADQVGASRLTIYTSLTSRTLVTSPPLSFSCNRRLGSCAGARHLDTQGKAEAALRRGDCAHVAETHELHFLALRNLSHFVFPALVYMCAARQEVIRFSPEEQGYCRTVFWWSQAATHKTKTIGSCAAKTGRPSPNAVPRPNV